MKKKKNAIVLALLLSINVIFCNNEMPLYSDNKIVHDTKEYLKKTYPLVLEKKVHNIDSIILEVYRHVLEEIEENEAIRHRAESRTIPMFIADYLCGKYSPQILKYEKEIQHK